MKFKSNLHGKVTKRRGFTLIEVVVALAILVIIIASTMSLLASSYTSLRNTEMKGIAKNIATYAVEYIRARNVTSDNNFINTSDWYDETTNPDGKFPGLVDLWDIALRPNGNDHSTTINVNPALPGKTYQDKPKAFYYSLQGYDSLEDFDNLTASNPSQEDANLYICNSSVKHYHCRITNNHILWKFPLISTDSNAIKSFTAGPNYIPKIYVYVPPGTLETKDPTNQKCPNYSPYFTKDSSLKKKTQDYRGFRVLTTVVARTNQKDPDDPENAASNAHVQYYDVKVVVFWMVGNHEHSYTLQTQIVTYGGS